MVRGTSPPLLFPPSPPATGNLTTVQGVKWAAVLLQPGCLGTGSTWKSGSSSSSGLVGFPYTCQLPPAVLHQPGRRHEEWETPIHHYCCRSCPGLSPITMQLRWRKLGDALARGQWQQQVGEKAMCLWAWRSFNNLLLNFKSLTSAPLVWCAHPRGEKRERAEYSHPDSNGDCCHTVLSPLGKILDHFCL